MKDSQFNTKITCHIIFKTFIRLGKCECEFLTLVFIPEYLLNPFNS